ncbi:hypothetical protein [Yinghuangia seranimata]|uniref:hypothetical protein n=1 Tax=Yinghuangia seranimata TaxID=408067 RepID=UPI00248AABCA|nr:hypothetical protein [Yinghuangia seranimata]MDI2131686.1 hypothetical protein [Yinghuangia seranimata]
MPGFVLHQGVTITCPHGGSGTLVPSVANVTVDRKPVAVEGDTTTVAGCGFNVAGAPSPCVQVRWMLPATRLTAGGHPLLLSSSVGLCVNVGGAPQGTAVVSGYQTKVRGV